MYRRRVEYYLLPQPQSFCLKITVLMSIDYCRRLYESDTTLHFLKILCVVFVYFPFIIFFYVVQLLLFQLAVCRFLFSFLFSRFNKPSWMKDWSNECICLHRNFVNFLITFRSLDTKIR
jgi:hypothetical protein